MKFLNLRISGLLFTSYFFLYCWFPSPGYAKKYETTSAPQSHFSQAKRIAKLMYADHRVTFYCGCRYDKHNKVDLHSCGYLVQKDKRRARRLEWEHIMPVSLWGNQLACWKLGQCCKKNHCYKGRACCRKIDRSFAKMEADLHNIVPESGELNALRSNYRFGFLPHIPQTQFGNCQMKIDPQIRQVEPPPQTRGFIARAYLYMAERYHISLSQSQIQLFRHWNKQYPPEVWEVERNKRILDIQGNDNPYITQYQEKQNE